ncbi:MAG: hypothetical protein ACLPVF_05645 [Acidimicrobiales bacterium]
MATYTPTGFAAAAISDLDDLILGTDTRDEIGAQRKAHLYFDDPYVALAMAGRTSDFMWARAGDTELFCLPLVSAWVDEPHEPDAIGPSQFEVRVLIRGSGSRPWIRSHRFSDSR